MSGTIGALHPLYLIKLYEQGVNIQFYSSENWGSETKESAEGYTASK